MLEPDDTIIIYGTTWCWDCHRARRLLKRHDIPYEWVDIDRDKQAEQYVLKANNGMRSVPTILFPDGDILVEPSNITLAQKLNIESA
jgi:mycoredoxin